jgi:hypothetical protein
MEGILVFGVGRRTYPVLPASRYWIHLRESNSLGFSANEENDRTMALPDVRL